MRDSAMKPVVVVGHVDHGKSTLIGRLLLETKSLPAGQMSELKKIAKDLGKGLELAYLCDSLLEERQEEKTIETTQVFLKTKQKRFCLIDVPGHDELIRQMVTGASMACAGLLVVDVGDILQKQTLRHLYLLKMFGLQDIIVVINKMDLVDYQETVFRKKKDQILNFLKTLGLRSLGVVAASAKEGANVVERRRETSWYKEATVLELLLSCKIKGQKRKNPLRFSVQDVYEMKGERIAVGRVISGEVRNGQDILVLPQKQRDTVRTIKVFGESRRRAKAPECIGLVFNQLLSVKRGMVISQKEEPPAITTLFKANLFWMGEKPLRRKRVMILRCATQEVRCFLERIEEKVVCLSSQGRGRDATSLSFNEAGVVCLRTEENLVVEKSSFTEELGRFILEEDGQARAIGTILDISPKL